MLLPGGLGAALGGSGKVPVGTGRALADGVASGVALPAAFPRSCSGMVAGDGSAASLGPGGGVTAGPPVGRAGAEAGRGVVVGPTAGLVVLLPLSQRGTAGLAAEASLGAEAPGAGDSGPGPGWAQVGALPVGAAVTEGLAAGGAAGGLWGGRVGAKGVG